MRHRGIQPFRRAAPFDRTLAAQSLLAGIAERGADAVGYAHRAPGEPIPVVDEAADARRASCSSGSPCRESATELLVHVRDYTKGHPSISANNHPVRHGPVVGIHNGIILNDDELLAPHSCARSEPRMTVDSEAIFALAAHSHNDPRALEELRGSLAAAWLDSRVPDTVFAARGAGRPLWIGAGKHELFFASTRVALEVVERYVRVKLRKREVVEGTFLRSARRAGSRASTTLPLRRRLQRPDRAPGRARTARRRLLPRAARRSRRCLSPH